ncbi:arginine--tRNA ligase [Candidatus Uhrbacteria bacterium]|nr:MAG: arginine--tRNA ligase [Candidatus Uhrbacteria bacterium]
MTTAWNYWTVEIAKRLSALTDSTIEPGDLVVPPDSKLGDLAFGCFKLAKSMGKSPAEIAKDLASKFDIKNTDIESVAAAGPYVNFLLSTGFAVHRVIRDIEVSRDQYGNSTDGANRQLVLEYAQPNTHKEIHVGHLRNLVLGVSENLLLKKAGWEVVTASYHGDVGAHVAKCLWWMVKSRNGVMTVDDLPMDQRTGKYLGQLYAEATRQLDEHPEYKDEISSVQQKLEAHDPVWESLWLETRRWSLDEMAEIFDDLGVDVTRQYLESEVTDRGQQMVDTLLEKGIAKESQGAMIVDLEDVKLGVFLVRKSDGTSLYGTKDLALAEKKHAEYPKAERSLILVDNRQQFYFKQLFETLKRMGITVPHEFIGYEFVTLKSGAMSSREGNIVAFQDFRDSVIDYARGEVLKRHEDWTEGKVTHVSWCIAMAGIKFGMLKQDSDKIFTFDLEQALSFDGDTGPYCLYAAARLASILRKAGPQNPFDGELASSFDHASEKALALVLSAFPSKTKQAAAELRPAIIAQWCLDASQAINAFYRDVPVLESEGELREGRIRLATVARETLSLGLGLLGIRVPDEM